MSDTTFVDYSSTSVVNAAWLNDINSVVYHLLGQYSGTPGTGVAPTTRAQLLANLGLSAPQSGTTAQRPTTLTNPAAYVGMQYLDFTLGNGTTTAMPIWCSNITGTTVTWTNAAGVAV